MSTLERPVALFAGATAGLGEAILKAYARTHRNARIYFIGRNEDAAQKIIDDVRRMWKDSYQDSEAGEQGDIAFLKADLTLLANVRGVVDEFIKREGPQAKLDLLCMSQGYLTLRGRIETSEHHDAPFVLHLYSRIYLVYLLLPYLQRSNAKNGARVISVHAPGRESTINLDDLDLKERVSSWVDWIFPSWLRALTGLDPVYMLSGRVSHSSVMKTLFFEELAKRERETANGGRGRVSFLHVFPGLVKTDEFQKGDFPYIIKFMLTNVMLPLLTPFTVAAETDGEAIASMAEDPRFGYAVAEDGSDVKGKALGSDGVVGSGAYCLKWDGKRLIKDGVMKPLRERGVSEKVWDHCMGVFDSVPGNTGS